MRRRHATADNRKYWPLAPQPPDVKIPDFYRHYGALWHECKALWIFNRACSAPIHVPEPVTPSCRDTGKKRGSTPPAGRETFDPALPWSSSQCMCRVLPRRSMGDIKRAPGMTPRGVDQNIRFRRFPKQNVHICPTSRLGRRDSPSSGCGHKTAVSADFGILSSGRPFHAALRRIIPIRFRSPLLNGN